MSLKYLHNDQLTQFNWVLLSFTGFLFVFSQYPRMHPTFYYITASPFLQCKESVPILHSWSLRCDGEN